MKKIASIVIGTAMAFAASAAGNVMLRDSFACAERGLFDRIVRAGAENDNNGFMRMLGSALADKKCVMLSKGDQVQVDQYELTKGVKQVRRSGTQTQYWTFSEAVR